MHQKFDCMLHAICDQILDQEKLCCLLYNSESFISSLLLLRFSEADSYHSGTSPSSVSLSPPDWPSPLAIIKALLAHWWNILVDY